MNKLIYYIFLLALIVGGSAILFAAISDYLNVDKITFPSNLETAIKGDRFINYYVTAGNFKIYKKLNSGNISIENSNGVVNLQADKFLIDETNFEIRNLPDGQYYIPINCNFLKIKTKFTETQVSDANTILENVTCVEDYKTNVEDLYTSIPGQ